MKKIILIMILFAAALILSCGYDDPLRPPEVSSIDAVEIFYPVEGDIVTKAVFSCSDVVMPGTQSEIYRVQLSHDADFTTVEIERESGNYSYIGCNDLYAGSWYIRASASVDGGDWGQWSPAVSFTTQSLIEPAEIVLTRLNDDEMRVNWPDIEDCDEYRISWGGSPVFSEQSNRTDIGVSEKSIWLSRNLQDEEIVYLRVQDGWEGIACDPVCFTNIWDAHSPMDGGVEIDTTPLLRWAAIEGAGSYELQFAASEAALTGSTVRTSSSPQYQVAAGDAFSEGDTIFWRIRAITGSAAALNWSKPVSFDVIDTSALAVGDKYAGGYVFFLNSGTGLCASFEDLNYYDDDNHYREYYSWGDNTIDVSAAESVDDGQSNTDAIVTVLGEWNEGQWQGYYAAKACSDFESFGYEDWFLPAYNQLIEMRDAIGSNGTFITYPYWSSTQDSTTNAQTVNIPGTSTGVSNKINYQHVRAARIFNY